MRLLFPVPTLTGISMDSCYHFLFHVPVYPRPSPSLYGLDSSNSLLNGLSEIYLTKWKSKHVTPLRNTSQWFPIVTPVKSMLLSWLLSVHLTQAAHPRGLSLALVLIGPLLLSSCISLY